MYLFIISAFIYLFLHLFIHLYNTYVIFVPHTTIQVLCNFVEPTCVCLFHFGALKLLHVRIKPASLQTRYRGLYKQLPLECKLVSDGT